MYIIYDTKTGEYMTQDGDWWGVEDDHKLFSNANVFETAEEAGRMIDEILRLWDKRWPTPAKAEYEVRKVRSLGWVLEE